MNSRSEAMESLENGIRKLHDLYVEKGAHKEALFVVMMVSARMGFERGEEYILKLMKMDEKI